MAQPIQMEIPPRDPKRELLARLEAAPAEHAAALLEGYELLQALHESGMLTLARGAIGAGTTMVNSASEAANTPEAIRAMRNAILLSKLLGSIEPEILEGACVAVGQSMSEIRTLPHEPPSLFVLLRTMFSRDIRRLLMLGTGFLRNLSRQL